MKSSNLLVVDPAASNALFTGSLALLPATEVVVLNQPDWSDEIVVNPDDAFEECPVTLSVSPILGRRGVTTVTFTGTGFTPNSYSVSVIVDGQNVLSGQQSDAVGRVAGSFTIPEATRIGSRKRIRGSLRKYS